MLQSDSICNLPPNITRASGIGSLNRADSRCHLDCPPPPPSSRGMHSAPCVAKILNRSNKT
eukprot:4062142-Alexandrium_andersonii.AAC.1